MYGALELPAICDQLWFSIRMMKTVWMAPLPAEESVQLMGAVWVTPPPAPEMVIEYVPLAAVPGLSVSVLLPLATLAGLKLADAPEGRPLTLSATALENPPLGAMVTVSVAAALPVELTVPLTSVNEKSGVPVLPA